MKRMLLTVAALFLAGIARAQTLPAQAATTTPGTEAGWFPVGGKFGANRAWQFGIDTSATVGGCVQREVHDGQWLGGPCRDLLLLEKNGQATAHLGAAVMYNAEHGNATYSLRAGVNVGPAAKAVFAKVVDKLPYLESVADWKAPRFLAYLGGITTLDYAVGYRPVHNQDVRGNLTHGPMVKLDLPLEDVYALIKAGL